MVSCFSNLLVDAFEPGVFEGAVGKPVKTKEAQKKTGKCFDNKKKLPRSDSVVYMANPKGDKPTEGPKIIMSGVFVERD
jgi:hypothetical protein